MTSSRNVAPPTPKKGRTQAARKKKQKKLLGRVEHDEPGKTRRMGNGEMLGGGWRAGGRDEFRATKPPPQVGKERKKSDATGYCNKKPTHTHGHSRKPSQKVNHERLRVHAATYKIWKDLWARAIRGGGAVGQSAPGRTMRQLLEGQIRRKGRAELTRKIVRSKTIVFC